MRTVKQEQFAAKRSSILQTALRLTLSKGFDEMSIQDVLDALDISKGAFFHYYKSKGDLLEAMVGQMLETGIAHLTPIVHDDRLAALDKLCRFFATLIDWKTGQKSFFLSVVRVWYRDENAIVRQKVREGTIGQVGKLLGQIIEQGQREGAFAVPFPDQQGMIVVAILEAMTDSLSKQLLGMCPGEELLARMSDCVEAHTATIERALGAPGGSIRVMGKETLEQWLSWAKDAGQGEETT